MNKNLLIELKEISYRILKSLNANLIQNCNHFENFTGRDIDAFYEKKIEFKKVSKNIIVRDKNKNDLRFCFKKAVISYDNQILNWHIFNDRRLDGTLEKSQWENKFPNLCENIKLINFIGFSDLNINNKGISVKFNKNCNTPLF